MTNKPELVDDLTKEVEMVDTLYPIITNSLACMIHMMKDLNAHALAAYSEGLNLGEEDPNPIIFDPAFFNKYTDEHKLARLSDEHCRSLGAKLIYEAATTGLMPCDAYDLAHGMFHAQMELLGITESMTKH